MTPMRGHGWSRGAFVTSWALAALVLASFPSYALDCDELRKKLDDQHRDPPFRLSTLLTNKCLGDEADQDPLAKKVRDEVLAEAKPGTTAEQEAQRAAQDESVERVLRAFDLLDQALQTESRGAPDAARAQVAALDAAIRASRDMVRAAGRCVPKETAAPEIAPPRFRVDPNSLVVPGPPTADLMKVLGSQCGPNAAAANCSSEIALAEKLARVSTLAESTLTFYTSCFIDAADEAASVLDRKWTTYFEDARSQYPWELVFNGWRMDRNDTREVSNGNRMGFLQPPPYQWILVHPSVALEYVSDAPDGQQFKPAVLVEAVGYNRWKYEPDGSMGGGWGVSAVALFADRGEVKDLGYGLMMHIHNTYSVGVMRHDSDTGFVVSGDVSDLWLKVSQKWRAKLPAR